MDEILVSEIQIIPIKPRNGLLAFCSFVLNHNFYAGNIAIYSRLNGNGYRLVYPTKVLPNGAKVSCFCPINRESAQAIEERIIEVFINLVEKSMKTEEAKYGKSDSETSARVS